MSTRPTGTKRRRGPTTWQLVVDAGRDPRTGRRRQKTKTFHGTERQADHELVRLLIDVETSTVDATTATVADLVREWMTVAGPDMSPGTVEKYRWSIDVHIVPRIGHIRVGKLDGSHLERLYTELRQTGGRCRLGPKAKCKTYPCGHGGGDPLAQATVKKVHVILHAALEQACRWKWLPRNPADDIARSKRIKVKRRKPKPATKADVAFLISWLHECDPEMWTFTVLAARRGARPGEICALRWPDIDLDAGEITFARNILARRGGGYIEKPTKTDNERTVALVGDALVAVRAHRRFCVERSLMLGEPLAADAFVFQHTSDGTRPWKPGNLAQRLRRACTRAGIAPVTFTQLRHYVATTLITKGVDMRTVSGVLGHDRTSTTSDIYADWVPGADRAAAELLDDVDDETG